MTLCIHEAFTAQAARTPDSCALVDGDERLTYRGLDARANALARRLLRAGAGGGEIVGVHLPRSAELVVALLAVLKTGAAVTVLDPEHPAERLRSVAVTTGLRLVVSPRGVRPPWTDATPVDPANAGAATADPGVAVSAEGPAVVMFTSGSTGAAKGVLTPHRAVVGTLLGQDYAEFGPGEVWLQSAPPSWDAFWTELFGPLLSGGTVILQPGQHPDPHLMAALCAAHGVTVLKASASLFNHMLDEHPAAFAGLRRAMTGGEAASAAHVAACLGQFGQVRLTNGYGPVESMGYTIAHQIGPADAAGGEVPIGRPVAGKGARVVDEALRPVPVGEVGELYVTGVGLAHGYLGRPGQTAQRFVADPLGAPGGRMYRTGDLARERPDGTLEFRGRIDDQIKIRGNRVEPAEVEAVLARHPAVRQVAVLGGADDAGWQRLVAYVVGDVTGTQLRDHLAARLPDFMVPSAYVSLEALPLTGNGKLDRRALPAPPPVVSGTGRSPATDVEERLCALFADVLSLDVVSVDDDFFLLGGHSLLAATMLGRLRAQTGVQLPVRAVFDAPTPERLALRFHGGTATQTSAIPRRPAAARAPLSPYQARLWFADRLNPDTAEYLVPVALRLRGPVAPAALVTALNAIAARHEALRVRVIEGADGPEQIVTPAVECPLDAVAIDAGRVDEFVGSAASTPIDLTVGPVWRAILGRIADDDHVLVICLHHIVTDDWSLAVMADELAHQYAAALDVDRPPLPVLTVQYPDVAAWQAGHPFDLDYWRHRLAGMPQVLELPTDRPRPRIRDLRGARRPFRVPAPLVRRLTELSRDHQASLFMTLLAAFQILLSRYGGETDFAVGAPVAGREHPATHDLVGFFVNTVVLRAELSDNPTFHRLIDRVRGTALDAYDHGDVPFDQVVEALQPERDLARNPLVQVMFALQTAATADFRLTGLAVERLRVDNRASKFDLFVALEQDGDELAGSIEYPVALFDASTVDRIATHYLRLLAELAAAPDRPVAGAAILDDHERRGLAAALDGPEPVPAAWTVPALVTTQATARPDAIAVQGADAALTYGELEERANRLANWLRRHGVGRETAVAVCLERDVDVPVVLLGILKAGGCYVPLDAAYPADRIAYMLDDTRAPLVIAHRHIAGELGVGVTVWEDLADELAAMPADLPAVRLDPDQLAYIMYTSGSTGRPKGAEIPHRAIARLVAGCTFTDLDPDQVLLLLAPLSFDASTFELWGALCTGAKLAVLPPGIPTPDELRAAIRQHGVTTMWLTAGLFHSVVEADPTALAGLRHLITGGDVVSATHVRTVVAATGITVGDGYGPTECTTFTCVKRAIDPANAPVPIGRPIPHTRLRILDRHLHQVPVGVVGELAVNGPGLARGYRGRPALTAEKFVADTLAPGERMYRTGDLVRLLPSGDLEIVGRIDSQVKIRGFRIEPAEVEARLESHPGVERAVVLAREDTPGDKRLVGYVVGDAAPTGPELRSYCRGTLPEHLVPAAVVRLAALPLDPNGKVDRRALPAPDYGDARESYVAPRTPTEAQVARIWADVLGVDRPGVEDNFFELGGHSLLATRIIAQLWQRFGVDLRVRALFHAPTIAALATAVDNAAHGVAEPIPPSHGDAPLSVAQTGLWFADRLAPNSREYLVGRGLRIRGPLDVDALRAALTSVVSRHEPLRTRFLERDGRPLQHVDPPAPVPLPVSDVDDEEAFLRRQVDRPIDISKGPIFQAELGRVRRDEHILLLCVHHIVADGWSLQLLADEIGAAYPAHRDGREPELPEVPVRYGDVAAWQAGRSAQAGYWRDRLAGMPQVVELPSDRPRPAVRNPEGAIQSFLVPPDVAQRVGVLAAARGATRFMVLLAAFQVLINRYTGLRAFGVGTPVAGREHPDTARLIGHFVNTVVMRADLTGDPDFVTLLARVRADTVVALDHQDVPFDRIVEELQPVRDMSRNPLVQVVFAVQDGIGENWRLRGTEVHPMPVHSRTSKFDLFVALREGDAGLTGAIEYTVELFDAETVARLAGHYVTLLDDLTRRPDRNVDLAPMLRGGERDRVVREVNASVAPYPDATLHVLVAEQACRSPEAVAVECGDRRLTYRQLDCWANGLAARLVALGVGPDRPVGVRVERSLELIVGLLAVLKAGGAYVPIETDAPDARVATVLADASAPVCLIDPGSTATPDVAGVVFWPVDPASAPEAPPVRVDPDNLVSIYYTSGSTGRPKGVSSTHRGWVNRMHWMQETYKLRSDEAVLQKTTMVFDDSAVECFWPLLVGARVVLIAPGLHRDPAAIRDAAIRHRVAVLQFVPSMLALFLDCLAPRHRAELGALRHVISSGEALQPELLRPFHERLDGAVLHNQWGATEVSIDSTARHCTAADEHCVGSVSVGLPIANNTVHVLDAELEPVPVGVPGDLFIGGVGLARGYHADPARTAGAYLPSPFDPGQRLYRTGDRGIRRADGSITFLGRQDDQLKIRGIRVEPGEVEQTLRELPGVRDAVVSVRQVNGGDKGLAGYVVPQPDTPLTAAKVRELLRDRLPSYLVPATITLLTEFPATASGKVDRRALPQPDTAAAAEVAYRPPEGPVAELVAETWADVLNLSRMGADDNFFDLGGHSLLATRAISRLRAALDAEIPLSLIFLSATVQAAADSVERILLAELATAEKGTTA